MTDAMTEDTIRERVSGEQIVHRLREWNEGDTVWGVMAFDPSSGTSTGKSFREGHEYGEGAEQKARERYERPGLPMSGVTVLYRATVQNPRSEGRVGRDAEPPLKFATLTEVEILNWKQTGGDDSE